MQSDEAGALLKALVFVPGLWWWASLIFRKPRDETPGDIWETLRDLRVRQPDGTWVRVEWRWVPCEAPAEPEKHNVVPPKIILGGKEF